MIGLIAVAVALAGIVGVILGAICLYFTVGRFLLAWTLYGLGHIAYLACDRLRLPTWSAYQWFMRWSDRIGGEHGPWGDAAGHQVQHVNPQTTYELEP